MCPTMARTIKRTENGDSEQFYDWLAGSYDRLAGQDDRFAREKPFFNHFIDRYRIASAVDAGCGTGFHSILLAQMGVNVVAADISGEMLQKVRSSSRSAGVQIRIIKSGFHDLAARAGTTVDAVLCLGNSLVHVRAGGMNAVLRNFSFLLKPGGVVLLQVLNYEKILAERPDVLSRKTTGGTEITRSYEYSGGTIRFVIRTAREGDATAATESRSIEITPWMRQTLEPALASAGLATAQVWGSFAMTDFDARQSRDLIILAEKVNETERR